MSAASQIKERMLAGETLDNSVAKQLGVSKASFNYAIGAMRKEGIALEAEHIGGGRLAYKVKAPKKVRTARKTSKAAQAPPSPNGDGNSEPSAESQARMERARKAARRLPELGAELVVTSLNYDPESGDRTVTLQAGNQTWFMEVVK